MTCALWTSVRTYTLQVTFSSSPEKWIGMRPFHTLKKNCPVVLQQDLKQHWLSVKVKAMCETCELSVCQKLG